ncbi:acyl-CoA-binding domain-containing protein 4 isoform X2 [Phalaenopsis equestris]|nr:acyl-CoA-binding domain-containing protein 4 isoform X2 [Phalaenopsis equestris]XP_020574729.1 acyl-CoA-binding domain-containing protein 4 isoform X2 [Phalaenopsis equestris]XP_020574731.1 acyl-CoA-binding domain-containing protein 4 isoform X2 [Phalaenopsis equestris]
MVNGRYNLNALLSELHYDDWTLLHSFGRRPLARYKHAIAVAQDKLFVIGGSRNGRYFSDVHVFNLRSLTWSLLNPRIDAENIGLENSTSKEVFPTIAGHSLVEWENKLLVIAGHSKEKSDSVIVWSIDLKTLVFSILKTQGKIPVARAGQSVTIVGSKLIMFGGEDEKRQLLNDLHILDLITMTWDVVETKNVPPSPRFDHTATEYAGRYLFIFGGSTQSLCLSDLHVLDLQNMEWSQPDVQGVAVTPRGGHAGATVGDMWYIVGGGNTTRGATETIVLNMSKLAWSDATMVTTQHPLASEGLSLSTISVDEESLLIAFGGYNGRYSNQLFVLRPKPRLPTKPKLYQSPAAAAAAASVTAAYAFATSTGTKDNDPVDENLKKEQVTRHPEAESFATEMLAVEEKNLGSKLADVRRENAKVEGNLEDVRNRQSLLAMELKAVQSQLEAERSRCFKLEIQISDIQKRLDSMVSIERELDILRQERSNMEQDMARVQRQSSGGLLRWMTG